MSSVQIRLKGSEEKLEELRHFISICAGCKQVRNDRGEWEGIETYLRHVTDRELTHGICPTCRERLYGSIGR